MPHFKEIKEVKDEKTDAPKSSVLGNFIASSNTQKISNEELEAKLSMEIFDDSPVNGIPEEKKYEPPVTELKEIKEIFDDDIPCFDKVLVEGKEIPIYTVPISKHTSLPSDIDEIPRPDFDR